MINVYKSAAFLASIALSLSVQAGFVFNTGVGANGISLPDGTIGDPHYTLIGVPGGTTTIRVRTSSGGYPIPPYIGDSATSAWIGPNNDTSLTGPVGTYTYRTTFDLTGFDPSSATITGNWSSDNDGIGIKLNGVTIAGATLFEQFSHGYVSFGAASGFLPGLNTLDFILNNGGGPTALRVEMVGTATAVPEPSTYLAGAMLLIPFGLQAVRKLRNRS